MAKEYKFMFDRRFDEPDFESVAEEDLSVKSVDGIPSISQLLDTLNEQIESIEKTEEKPPETSTEAIPPAETPPPVDESVADAPVDEKTDTPVTEQEEITAPPAEEPPAPPPAPAFTGTFFTQEQIDEIKEKAREEGRLAGLDEGREAAWQEAMVSLEKQNADTLISIDASLKDIFRQSEESAQNAFSTALEFALAVCRKATPAICATNALEEIRSLLEKNLHFLKDEPKISLRLNPFLADKIKPALADLIKKEAYHGKIAVVRDDDLAVGDCRVEWKNGGLEKNLQDVLNHTEELLKLYTHSAPTDETPADHTGEENHG